MVKDLPAMQEMQVRSLGCEDPLEKGMAAHSSILAWRIPWTAEPGGLQSTGSQESDTTEGLRHTVFMPKAPRDTRLGAEVGKGVSERRDEALVKSTCAGLALQACGFCRAPP